VNRPVVIHGLFFTRGRGFLTYFLILMSTSHILITGGAGFIGSHLALRLRETNKVRLFDNFRRDSLTGTSIAEHPNVELIRGDLLNPSDVSRAVEGVDTILHLGAIAGVSSYYNQSLQTLKVNILGTQGLLDVAAKTVRRFVHFSTSEVFGSNALHVTEEDCHGIGPTGDRRWVYATSKLAGEHFVLRYGEEFGFHACCLRPFNVYGPRQTGEGAISNFCTAVTKGQPLTVYGDGSAIRAWCYVSDMVEGTLLALENPAASGQVFNIGNAREIETTHGLARRICALGGGSSNIRTQPMDRAEVAVRIPRIDKARHLLGYEPKVDLDTGLTHTLAWYRETISS